MEAAAPSSDAPSINQPTTPQTTTSTTTLPDTVVAIKISIQGVHKKLKLPLADLVPAVLPVKVRFFCFRPAVLAC